jgi:hypothetical protein
MNFKFLKVEGPGKNKKKNKTEDKIKVKDKEENKDKGKKKKLTLFQLANIKKIKKRNLAIAGVILLAFILFAGSRITGLIFQDKGLTGEKTEAAAAEQIDTGNDADREEAGKGAAGGADSAEADAADMAKTETGGAAEDTGADTALSADLENHLATDFIRTLKSGKYVIRYTTTTVYEGQPYEVETTYAVSGGSIALVAGDRATVVRDDKVYMMNHTDRTVLCWDVNHEKGSPERIDTKKMAFVGSKQESGLVCEEYSTASSRLKLYFNGKELVRMAARISKEDMVMDIVSVDQKAPASLFEVPAGYQTTYL